MARPRNDVRGAVKHIDAQARRPQGRPQVVAGRDRWRQHDDAVDGAGRQALAGRQRHDGAGAVRHHEHRRARATGAVGEDGFRERLALGAVVRPAPQVRDPAVVAVRPVELAHLQRQVRSPTAVARSSDIAQPARAVQNENDPFRRAGRQEVLFGGQSERQLAPDQGRGGGACSGGNADGGCTRAQQNSRSGGADQQGMGHPFRESGVRQVNLNRRNRRRGGGAAEMYGVFDAGRASNAHCPQSLPGSPGRPAARLVGAVPRPRPVPIDGGDSRMSLTWMEAAQIEGVVAIFCRGVARARRLPKVGPGGRMQASRTRAHVTCEGSS